VTATQHDAKRGAGAAVEAKERSRSNMIQG